MVKMGNKFGEIKVKAIISELVIELDHLWTFHETQGSRLKIAGLLPGRKEDREEQKKQLQRIVLGKVISIDECLFVVGDMLCALVSIVGKPLQDFFPERKIITPEPSRWIEPEENKYITKIVSGIPVEWHNPLDKAPIDKLPFLRNLKYPTKFWDRDFNVKRKLFNAIYSESRSNEKELNRWFSNFLSSPQKDAPLVCLGDVGIGKSSFIAQKLMNLPQEKYHVVIVDLRYTLRGDELKDSIREEIEDYLNHYITDLSWLHPEFKSIYGEDFDPNNPEIKKEMRNKALTYSRTEIVRKKLQFYNSPGAPELIVAFDNVDHFNENEQLAVIDMCRRIIGNCAGVRIIVTLRPTTELLKARLGLLYGDCEPKYIVIKAPDVYKVLEKRFSYNYLGESLNIKDKVPASELTWEELLKLYKESDHIWGSARLIKELCSTDQITTVRDLNYMASEKLLTDHSPYDLRHYLKLFRHILYSDAIDRFENIGKRYYAIHALMLRNAEPMNEATAYLFNLFDNGSPDKRGNALLRYRALEYCKLYDDFTNMFEVYFSALGHNVSAVRAIVHLYEESGLVKIRYADNEQGMRVPQSLKLTIAGYRHFEIIANLWYIICVKTGMNIFEECILYGDEARKKASEFIRKESLLDFYAKHGWISEDQFINFLGQQEHLEYQRIGNFQELNPPLRAQIANWMQKLSSPAAIIHWNYHEQREYWLRHNKRRSYDEV